MEGEEERGGREGGEDSAALVLTSGVLTNHVCVCVYSVFVRGHRS